MGNLWFKSSRPVRRRDRPVLVDTFRTPINRLFLIGSGGVGKSTILKQLQNICLSNESYQMFNDQWKYMKAFDDEERVTYRQKVHQNIFMVIGTLIKQAGQQGIRIQYRDLARDVMQQIRQFGELETLHQRPIQLSPQTAKKIGRLWTEDSGIARVWNRRNEFAISDSTEYLLRPEFLETAASPGYVPSIDDILRVRDPTVGMHDYNFRFHEQLFTIHDVGGQQPERRKLPQYINNWLLRAKQGDRNFILYVAAISDYNRQHPTYPNKTKLDESIDLLKVLLDYQPLEKCRFIMFFNKHDIFQEKLKHFNDFHRYFDKELQNKKKRSHDHHSLRDAENAVAARFAKAVCDQNSANSDKPFYYHFTTAIDARMMQRIFSTIRKDIIDGIITDGAFLPM